MKNHAPIALTAILLCTSGCTTGFSPREAGQCEVYDEVEEGAEAMLAIGDSVFAWRMRSCSTVPDVAAQALGMRLEHRAVNGARLTGGDHPIVEQFGAGAWDWVLVDGGGNDLNNECECGVDCDGVLDALVSEDGATGELPALLDTITQAGHRVALYGYFRIDERAFYDFDACIDELDELHARQELAAEQRPGVLFVDAREVVTPDGVPEAYAFDHVHPSAQGAEIVGQHIAASIKNAMAE